MASPQFPTMEPGINLYLKNQEPNWIQHPPRYAYLYHAEEKLRGATIAQWIHLCFPSCRSGFESQVHHLRSYQVIFEL